MQIRYQWQRLGTYALIVLLAMSLLTGCFNHSQSTQSGVVNEAQSEHQETPTEQANEIVSNESGLNKQQTNLKEEVTQVDTDNNKENTDDNKVEIMAKEDMVSKEPIILTIKGNGIKQTGEFTLADIKNMKDGYAACVYSAVNNWPAKKFFVGKGIKIGYLLEKLGMKDKAKTIIVQSEDGYKATFTKEQLLGDRYYYPNIMDESNAGKKTVSAIVAWENKEAKDLSKAHGGNLMLFLGQKSLHDVMTNGFVKQVNTIEVLTSDPGRWEDISVSLEPGKVEAGTEISFNHPEMDRVKIYYTLDGSIPTYDSLVYNPSTSYFQPQLTQPIVVKEDLIIKAFVSGLGRQDSEITTFQYEVK